VLVVGLTGNIAAGKSTVAKRLRDLGATVIDADVLAREAVAVGSPVLAQVFARFGDDLRLADGSVDRAGLRRRVFGDPAALAALNALIHPDVARQRDALIAEARLRGARIVVCDIPLLFETGAEGDYDPVVLVDAPEDVRLARLVRDRALPEEEARAMIAAQMPASEKRARADVVLDNAGTKDELRRQVDALWRTLEARVAGAS
jgi:dephospho-CoA kinase